MPGASCREPILRQHLTASASQAPLYAGCCCRHGLTIVKLDWNAEGSCSSTLQSTMSPDELGEPLRTLC